MPFDEESDNSYSKDLFSIKKDLETLKSSPLGDARLAKDLKDSVDSLNTTMKQMLDLFTNAVDTIKIEDHDKNVVSQKIEPLTQKIEVLSAQNEKIAKALVAIADMVKDLKTEKPLPNYSQPQMQQQQSQMQQQPQNIPPAFSQNPSFDMSPPMNNPPMSQMNTMPLPRSFEPLPGSMPPPMQAQEKKKLFHFK